VHGITAGSQVINAFGKKPVRTQVPAPSCLFQLSLSRSKPPAGSVEAMFRVTGSEKSSGSTRIGSSVSDSNLNNTTSAPVPKPRSNQPTPATQQNSSKLSLSDWDLEDFDE
jgi:hypothetical protein